MVISDGNLQLYSRRSTAVQLYLGTSEYSHAYSRHDTAVRLYLHAAVRCVRAVHPQHARRERATAAGAEAAAAGADAQRAPHRVS